MRARTAMTAGLALVTLSACGAPSASSDDGQESASYALAHSQSTGTLDKAGPPGRTSLASDVVSVGTCLTGETLGDDQDSLAAAIREFGVEAYEPMSDDPRWDAVVDCGRPHELEVYGLVRLPDGLDAMISAYADLLVPDSLASAQVRRSVTHQCAEQLAPVAGVMAGSALDVDVSPLVNDAAGATVSWNPVPPAAWVSGDRTFACLFDPGEAQTTEWSDVVTADFPLDDRLCIATTTSVPCDEPHEAERIATLVVNRAVESGQLRGHRALDTAGNLNLRRRHWAELDVVCQSYLDAIAASPAEGLTGVADTYPELYPDERGDYVIYCLAQSPFDTSPDDVVRSIGSVYDH